MSNLDQAQYLVSLPMTEFKAIKKAVAILKRGGMAACDALAITVQAHADRAANMREVGAHSIREYEHVKR